MKNINYSGCAAICLLAATLPSAASAELLGSKPNRGGGQMFITSMACGTGDPQGLYVFSTNNLGEVAVTGCAYELGESRMMIDWGEGRLNVIGDAWLPDQKREAPPAAGAKYMEM